MPLSILKVAPMSPASIAGIREGDLLSSINGEDIIDDIDYQSLTAGSDLHLICLRNGNNRLSFNIHKNEWQPLGLTLEDPVAEHPYVCNNHCIFCFMDQMPAGLRPTLYIKDDDWRMSFRSGSYITLNNLSDDEFKRILRRKPSPLYISVHAADSDTRSLLMGNRNAGAIMDRLKLLCSSGIRFHCQVVLCPGINDGEILEHTIKNCSEMYPYALSLAIVPVGLTKYRSSLFPISPCTSEYSALLLNRLKLIQDDLYKSIGTRFVFAADEFYCLSGFPVPDAEAYEDYPQYGNGVGMLRHLEDEFSDACASDDNDLNKSISNTDGIKTLTIATGVSAAPLLKRLMNRYSAKNIRVTVLPVKNRYFGSAVTVTGLITGRDLADNIRNCTDDAICISNVMLRTGEDVFLDGMTLEELRQSVHVPVIVTDGSGLSLYRLVNGMEADVK